jgi:MFS transporter, ACS family, hexuronate transporter
VAGVLHGGVTGWLSLAAARGFMGLTEAAAIPSGMKAVAEWFPDKEKSIAVGFFNVGTSFGAAVLDSLCSSERWPTRWVTARCSACSAFSI